MTSTPKPRRHCLQFSLRAMMVLVLVVSVAWGWFACKLKQAREQWAAIDAIRSLGGSAEYEGELDSYTDDDGPSMAFGIDVPPGCPAPAWLRRRLGDDFFARIVAVRGDCDGVLEHAARLPHLRSFYVGPLHYPRFVRSWPITDAGLEHLKASSQLETLILPDTKVTDAGLWHLKALPRLQNLCLRNTQITDAGLHHLTGLRQLQTLELQNTQVTGAGIDYLRKALPHLTIYR